ncbi:MAG: BBE domain-containing protein, partial [Bauldia litoralis]
VITMPARHWWDFEYRKQHYPKSIVADDRPGVQPGAFWWAGNQSEVGIFLTGYDSAWLPESLLADGKRGGLAKALVDASRNATVTLHFNKGLAGAPKWVRDQARSMAIHPSAAGAFALAIVALGQDRTHPGVPGHEPDLAKGRKDAERVKRAMAALRSVAPDTGSYCSEASYFTEDWRERSWGPNYPRLLAAKQKYDPAGLFFGHHWVGSEFWSRDGFRPKR